MAKLLIVHHTTSPSLREMFEAVVAGTRSEGIEGIEVTVLPALAATANDVLAADGFVIGTPVNIGYISGALKHFFDQIYYPCMDLARKPPYGAYLHAGSDASGALRAIESICSGMGWRAVQAPWVTTGAPGRADREALQELGARVAAELMT